MDEAKYARVRSKAIASLEKNEAQFPTKFPEEGPVVDELMRSTREEMVEKKVAAQDEMWGIKQRLSVTMPHRKFQAFEQRRKALARLLVLIDREFMRRKAKLNDRNAASGQKKAAAKDAIDWPRQFVRVAKMVLPPDTYGRVEAATEAEVAKLIAGEGGSE